MIQGWVHLPVILSKPPNRTQGKPIPTGGYINTEAQYEVRTNKVQSTVGVRTNYQPETLTSKGLRYQQIYIKMNVTKIIRMFAYDKFTNLVTSSL